MLGSAWLGTWQALIRLGLAQLGQAWDEFQMVGLGSVIQWFTRSQTKEKSIYPDAIWCVVSLLAPTFLWSFHGCWTWGHDPPDGPRWRYCSKCELVWVDPDDLFNISCNPIPKLYLGQGHVQSTWWPKWQIVDARGRGGEANRLNVDQAIAETAQFEILLCICW
jgi:hypothetical protein